MSPDFLVGQSPDQSDEGPRIFLLGLVAKGAMLLMPFVCTDSPVHRFARCAAGALQASRVHLVGRVVYTCFGL